MKRRALLALATASALVLTACGGDDPAEETTEPSGATETATEDMSESMAPTEDMSSSEASTEGAAAGLPDPLVFTLTPSQETGGLIETAQPLADMMSEKLGVTVEALVPTDYAGVIAALSSGQAHVAGGLGPRQMVQSEEQADATMILQSERFGSFSYVTQWFTNDPDTYCEDEPVAIEQEEGEPYLFCNGVAEAQEAYSADGTLPEEPIGQDALSNVAGQTVAFVDQGSTSGYAIPALQLLEAGVDPLDDIDGTFAGGHDVAVQAVYDGDAAVGVSFNDARGELVEQAPDVGQQVVVFGWSAPIPNDGFAVASSIDEAGTQAITDALVEICNDEGACGEGGVMYDLYEIDGLQEVNDAEFDVIRDLEAELGDALE
ncbi:phosphate/phosphite/phosphonate ABC transporter substrate-binding protein [Salsipaludibacter albus]|uniref:phosphate/phosphite/phosphonate ABC transporter substrate-binding protein n=1 Tax=Salsipaludibacter albus TaxID=2849650 RepID=UPI001EE4D66D|nr:phosphate/phosphite/phosphonate ABC transporter substrate-binding protein [Salsipaludibacter albus]MBY5163075.1 phosphate/phosphite/phosphonate ABC transporter substrate-binding protein [Salsipaludibacter albus]